MPRYSNGQMFLRFGDTIEYNGLHIVTICNDTIGDIQIDDCFMGLGTFYLHFRFDLARERWVVIKSGVLLNPDPMAERVSNWKLVQTTKL